MEDFSKVKFDLIVQAGQSNAEGNGRGPATENIVLSDDVYRLEVNKTVSIVKDDIFGENLKIEYPKEPFRIVQAQKYIDLNNICADYSISFAYEYEKSCLSNDRKILVIRAGVGGSGFMKGQWGVGRQLYNKMLEMIDYALSLNEGNRLVTFIWHQGEHDAFERNTPDVFEKQLSEMFADIRSKYADLPIITGDFCRDWADRHSDMTLPIRKVIRSVTESFNGCFVSSEGLTSNDQVTADADIIHFSRESQYILGKRYFDAYKKITEK